MHPTLVLAFLLTAGCSQSSYQSGAWQPQGSVEKLTQGERLKGIGWWPRVAYDSRGGLHLTYCNQTNGTLHYGYYQSDGWDWHRVPANGSIGKYLALATNSAGQPSIAYHDQTQKKLMVATQTVATWRIEEIAWGEEIGMGAKMLFDIRDALHLFYYLGSGNVVHAQRTAGTWKKSVITKASGGPSAKIGAALSPDGVVASFMNWGFRDSELLLATSTTGGGFALESLQTERGPGWRSTLTWEHGAPRLLFTENRTRALIERKRVGNKWQRTRLPGDFGNFAAVPHNEGWLVAFQDLRKNVAGQGLMSLGLLEDATFKTVVLDPLSGSGSHLDLARDTQGHFAAAFYSEREGSLYLFRGSLEEKK